MPFFRRRPSSTEPPKPTQAPPALSQHDGGTSQPAVPRRPDPRDERQAEVIRSMQTTLQQAEAGDPASEHHANGLGLWMNGQVEEALVELSEAARLGLAQAMKDAGDLTNELGRTEESRFWFKSAAEAGHRDAMWNMAVFALQKGDLASATAWYQRSAEAGLAEGYAALTQLARDQDDADAMRHWARLGAEAGQPFCMLFHGMHLAMDSNGSRQMLCQARDYFEQAAERGEIDAASMAVSTNIQLGDRPRAQPFIQMVVRSGNEEEIDRLRRYGYL